MNYFVKRVLITVGLLFVYWFVLFRYEAITNFVLEILGAFYLGSLFFKVAEYLIPVPQDES